MKFKSSRLKRFGYDISLTFDEAKELKEIIALADSQILRSIRDIQKRTVNYEKLEKRFEKREKLKENFSGTQNSEEIKKIQDKINRTMFIPEYITVVMDHPKHYDYIYHNGIIVNGKKYKRLSCSSSQSRVSTVVLCDEEILIELKRRLNNGRNENKPIAPSKFNAYFGLAGSATYKVSDPKFIVVRDFVNQTTFKSNFVTETDWNLDDEVDVRDVTLDMTRNDGMGLISPSQSQKWADELGLDWLPSQWCVRQNYIKGMLCTFPIHEFCEKVNGGNYIVDTIYKDESGNYIKADLRDYDVIISESQFKLWDSYSGVDSYIENCKKNKLYWGISQYTPKEPKDVLTLNYQFIQTLNLNQEDIEKLCVQFVDWICGVSYENVSYMLLFLLGLNNTDFKINNFLRSSDQYWIKSLILNPEIRNDRYIRSKIHNLIKYKLQKGCLGSIIVNGNFQVLVSDPYAMMQHVCGIEVTGLLKEKEFYSGYWNNKEHTRVDAMRSPLTYRSEHVVLDFIKNKETEYWYRYCQQGIILNYFGHEVVCFGGADFDYDILATTSNPVMINGVYKDDLPVVYEPPKPEKIVFTEDDLYHADTFSFGSIIGQITNKGSNAYAVLPLFEKKYGKDSPECVTTVSRLQQCCKAQSAQIDKTKIGKEVKGIPKVWTEKQKVNIDSDTADAVDEKDFYNRILLTKRPYFFKYLYTDAKKKYNQFVDRYEMTCHQKFQMTTAKLKALSRKTLEQKEFLKGFYDYMPLTYSDSPMNLLCRYIEEINFKISEQLKINPHPEIYNLYKNPQYEYTEEEYNDVVRIIKRHNMMITNNLAISGDEDPLDYDEEIYISYKDDNDFLIYKINEVCSNVYVAVNCLIDYYYKEKPASRKDILWDSYGLYIFKNIKQNTKTPPVFPFPCDNGDISYLGKKYKLQGVGI